LGTKEKDNPQLDGIASDILKAEANELINASDRIDTGVVKAAEIILNHDGKIVVCGLGKSGIIGQKIVATLCSTGTQAVFLHAGEALHGDLGIYKPGDPTILISKSGSTDEIIRLIPVLREFKSPLIAIIGNYHSPLAEKVDVVLDASVQTEADPLGFVPTSSTTLTMAIGDALAAVLMTAKRINEDDFARYHPGGYLGRKLTVRVKDIMQPLKRVAVVTLDHDLKETVILMTKNPQGAALVLANSGELLGIITDGDLRRKLAQNGDFGAILAKEVMNPNPVTINSSARLKEAVTLMEDRASQISVLPVLDDDHKTCIGLLRIHDVHQTQLT
jgi:arabinose-5-phosphate isomerase